MTTVEEQRLRMQSIDKVATIDITSRCNLRCKHCYNSSKYQSPTQEFSIAQVEAIFRYLHKHDFKWVTLLGGEPFVRNDLHEIACLAEESKLQLNLTTNAVWDDPDEAVRIASLPSVALLNVSLDGTSAKTNDSIRGAGVFDKVLRNIGGLPSEVRRKTRLAFVVTNINMDDVPNIPILCRDMGISMFSLTPLYPVGGGADFRMDIERCLDRLEEMAQVIQSLNSDTDIAALTEFKPMLSDYLNMKYPGCKVVDQAYNSLCRAGDKDFYIEADGNVRICHADDPMLRGAEYNPFGDTGHIHISDLLECEESVFKHTRFREFCVLKYSSYMQRLHPCATCSFSSECIPCPIDYSSKKFVDICIRVARRSSAEKKRLVESVPSVIEGKPNHTDIGQIESELLSRINGDCKLGQIIEDLHGEYDVDIHELTADMCALVNYFIMQDLVSLK